MVTSVWDVKTVSRDEFDNNGFSRRDIFLELRDRDKDFAPRDAGFALTGEHAKAYKQIQRRSLERHLQLEAGIFEAGWGAPEVKEFLEGQRAFRY